MYSITAGPTYLEDYFQKGAHLGQKATLNLWYVDTRPNSQKKCSRAFEGSHIWLITLFKKLMLSYIFYSHNSVVSF